MQNRIASMPIDINHRPQSALLRGVRITEFNGHIINPDPVVLQETDFLLDEFLSPTKLKALSGMEDLALVDNLEMIVDTSETSLGNFGIYLPYLKQLKLNGSHVPRIRDLGTSLINLKVLWLSRSSLTDLDGIPTLANLEEVYLAFNEITDLSPCSMLENLKCLDLEGNLIDDIKQIEFLNLCTSLENLTLYGNPICAKPTPDAKDNDESYSYRHEMIKLLPDLKILDDNLTLNTSLTPILKNIQKSPLDLTYQQHIETNQHECPFDDDWTLINQFIEEGIGPTEDKLAINESAGRPGTNSSRGSHGNRPLSAMRPLSSYKLKTAISNNRPNSRRTNSSNSNSSRLNTTDSNNIIDSITNDSSDLTVGPALQGNPLKALLARKKPLDHPSLKPNDSKLLENQNSIQTNFNNTIKEFSNENDDKNNENKKLHSEIFIWKKDHAKKLESRKEYFEPQILKIDDNPISDTEDEDEDLENENYENPHHKSKNEYDTFRLTRPKSSFKQCFDYEININEDQLSPRVQKSKNNSKFERNDSDLSNSSNRLATGDTGYDTESLSSPSLSSYMSLSQDIRNFEKNGVEIKSNLRSVLAPPIIHKPKILTQNGLIHKEPSIDLIEKRSDSNSGLKTLTLKKNLKPLPGIKPPPSSRMNQ